MKTWQWILLALLTPGGLIVLAFAWAATRVRRYKRAHRKLEYSRYSSTIQTWGGKPVSFKLWNERRDLAERREERQAEMAEARRVAFLNLPRGRDESRDQGRSAEQAAAATRLAILNQAPTSAEFGSALDMIGPALTGMSLGVVKPEDEGGA